MAARLKMTRTAVVGAFWALWSAASEHGEDGRIPDADADTIDYLTETPGFAAAAVAAKWLEFDDLGAVCPRWSEHNNGSSAKVRARERDKKRKQRTQYLRRGLSPTCPPNVPGTNGDKQGTGAGHVDHTDTDTDIDTDKPKDIAKPPEAANAAKGGKAGVKHLSAQDAKAYALPMHWPTEVREAFVSFIESRYAAGKRCTPKALDLLIRAVENMPPAARLASVNQSIANGYQGIFPAKTTGKGNDVRGTRRNEVVGDSDEHIDIPIYRADASGRVSRQAPAS